MKKASLHGRAPLRILHLEDNSLDAELIEAALVERAIPCSIKQVWTEEAFAAALNLEPVDLILSDSRLPGFDTFKALKYARENFPRVPFIFVSGDASPNRRADAFHQGATDFIDKGDLPKLARQVLWLAFSFGYETT